jgi:hypothetical protein
MDRTQAIQHRALARVGASLGASVDQTVETAKGDFTNVLLILGFGFGAWALLKLGAPAGYEAASRTKSAYREYRSHAPAPRPEPERAIRQRPEIPSIDAEIMQPPPPRGRDWYRSQQSARA